MGISHSMHTKTVPSDLEWQRRNGINEIGANIRIVTAPAPTGQQARSSHTSPYL